SVRNRRGELRLRIAEEKFGNRHRFDFTFQVRKDDQVSRERRSGAIVAYAASQLAVQLAGQQLAGFDDPVVPVFVNDTANGKVAIGLGCLMLYDTRGLNNGVVVAEGLGARDTDLLARLGSRNYRACRLAAKESEGNGSGPMIRIVRPDELPCRQTL
ncbi:MAG: hypothetical protein ACRD9W_25820, partial [Terriglobia bacterium]